MGVLNPVTIVGTQTDGTLTPIKVASDGAMSTGGNAADTALLTSIDAHLDNLDNAGTASVAGDAAHDAVDTGNPVKIGGKAVAALSGLTLPAAGDRANISIDLDGALIVRNGGAIGDRVSGVASNTDGASTEVIAAQAAGIKTLLTDVTLFNTGASFVYVEMKDGSTVKWRFPVPASGGVTHRFETPLSGSAATAWNFDPSAASTTVYCSAAGRLSKV